MLETFLVTLSPMLVMLICIAIGFILRKTKAAPENTATVLSRLELNVIMPALILRTFLTYCTVESFTTRYQTVLYGAVTVVLSVVMGILLTGVFSKDKDERKIYRYSLMIANFGFLGNAIVPAIMGQKAMYEYMLFNITQNIFMYVWAINSLIPEGKGRKKSAWQNLLNPPCVAIAIGIVLGLLGVGDILPGFVNTALGSLADCMAPIAMLLTGFVIGGYRMPGLLKNKRVYAVTLLRLIVLPAIIVGVLWLLGADTNTLFMALFATASALGLNVVVVPAAYDGDTHTGAAMAMISHVGAIVTIPLLYTLLTQLVGGVG